MVPSLQALTWLSIVISLGYLTVLAATSVVAAVRHGGRRDEPIDDHEALSVSRFTIPVSVIVSADNSSAPVSRAIGALLDLNYPELEVIVVAEHMPDAVLDALKSEWNLQAKEFFYRRTLKTAAVKHIYRSARDPRLMLVVKVPRGRADALNCGVNIARFRYVTSVGPDVVFDPDALLRAMSAALRDPAHIVGASSHVETRGTAAGYSCGRFTAAFQRLGSVRSLMKSRLAWRHLPCGLGPDDGIVVWRRDAIVHVGGFSATAADSDFEMMVRLQTSGADNGVARVVRTAEIFGRIDPRPLSEVVGMARRRGLASLQAILAAFKSPRNRLMGDFGARTMRYFVMSELITPLVQFWIILTTSAGAAIGWFSWKEAALSVVLLSFGNALVTNAALLVRGIAPGAPDKSELGRLLLLGPLELLLHWPALAYARTTAAWSLLKTVFNQAVTHRV